MAQSQCSGCPSASSCSAEQRENCDSAQQSMLEPANKYSKVKKVIGIVSGKEASANRLSRLPLLPP